MDSHSLRHAHTLAEILGCTDTNKHMRTHSETPHKDAQTRLEKQTDEDTYIELNIDPIINTGTQTDEKRHSEEVYKETALKEQ